MKILKLADTAGEFFPPGIQRLDYASGYDGFQDWALLLPGKNSRLWIIVMHGHGAQGDQLYMRQDLREKWLPFFLQSGAGLLTANLRGNSWMGPDAVKDMHALVGLLRTEYKMQKSIFCSGSMGGTGNLIYGILYPEDINGIIARGAASDLTTYYRWCRQQAQPSLQEIAQAIENAYGGAPDKIPDIYRRHSALLNAEKLVMPVFLSHGGADKIIPVEQSRALAARRQDNKQFFYHEIPGGNHDAPIDETEDFNRMLQIIGID